MASKDSIANTLIVAVGLCLVCATVVSTAAVGLRSIQDANKLKDRKANILAAAGLMENDPDVVALFDERIIDKVIDLDTGEDVSDQVVANEEFKSVADFDPIDFAESNNDEYSSKLEEDPATIKRRENWAHVYIVKTAKDDPTPLMYVFPIRGKGLWSILKGFIALDSDLNTIRGITFYSHAETPGLGGEVDNPEWKSHWTQNKLLFNESGDVAIKMVKADWKDNVHGIDALSGATITGRGVERMLEFWMSETGFGNYLVKLRDSK